MPREKRPMPDKGDMKNMVKLSLKGTGERMIEIADTLSDDGNRLSTADRKLVRMAMIPALEETFSEFVHFYVLGIEEAQTEAFHQLDRIAGLRF